jgi:hypothetical protein
VTNRRSWPVRRYRLGEEPGDDLSATTTPEERLRMLGALSAEAWALTGKAVAKYARHDIPIVRRPWRVNRGR